MYRNLGLILITSLLFLATSLDSFAQSGFKISPSTYNVTLTNLEPVELKYEFSNNLAAQLNFTLALSEDTKSSLESYKLRVYLVNAEQDVLLSSEPEQISIPAQTNKQVVLKLVPSESKDFNLKLLLQFKQVEAQQVLTQDEYDLTINLTSQLASVGQTTNVEIIIAAVVAGLAILLILITLLLRRKSSPNGQESI